MKAGFCVEATGDDPLAAFMQARKEDATMHEKYSFVLLRSPQDMEKDAFIKSVLAGEITHRRDEDPLHALEARGIRPHWLPLLHRAQAALDDPQGPVGCIKTGPNTYTFFGYEPCTSEQVGTRS